MNICGWLAPILLHNNLRLYRAVCMVVTSAFSEEHTRNSLSTTPSKLVSYNSNIFFNNYIEESFKVNVWEKIIWIWFFNQFELSAGKKINKSKR